MLLQRYNPAMLAPSVELLEAQAVGLIAEKLGKVGAVGVLETSPWLIVLDGHLAVSLPCNSQEGRMSE